MEVHRRPHGVDRPFAREVEVGDLAQRVHAGVGAAGAAQRNRLAREFVDRLGEAPLHRAPSACICQPTNGVPSYSSVTR